MTKKFFVTESKTCLRHIKRIYEMDLEIDESFVEYFSSFCEVESFDFSTYSEEGKKLYRFRNYELAFEIKAGINSNFIHAIFTKENHSSIAIFEEFLTEWSELSSFN